MITKFAEFELTAEHITLLRASWVSTQLSDYEYGAAQIDPKRPYGTGGVERSIAGLLGIEVDDEEDLDDAVSQRCRDLHEQTPTALQIVLVTGSFQPGLYRKANRYDAMTWQLVEAR